MIGVVDLGAKRQLLERLLRAADEDGQRALVMLLCGIDEDLLRLQAMLNQEAIRGLPRRLRAIDVPRKTQGKSDA